MVCKLTFSSWDPPYASLPRGSLRAECYLDTGPVQVLFPADSLGHPISGGGEERAKLCPAFDRLTTARVLEGPKQAPGRYR